MTQQGHPDSRERAPSWYGQQNTTPTRQDSTNLADILERVLDKGIVIAGDIQVNQLRLVVASVERAREMGIDWWENDPTLSSDNRELVEENKRLRDQLGQSESSRNGETASRERIMTDSIVYMYSLTRGLEPSALETLDGVGGSIVRVVTKSRGPALVGRYRARAQQGR